MNWLAVRHPLSINQVKEVQEKIGVDFPKDYIETIGEINGGALKNAYIELENSCRISYSRNVSLSTLDRNNIFAILDVFIGEDLLPIASVGNGDFFCIDLKKHVIVLWEHEDDTCINVANSFTELLAKIRQ